MSFKPYETFAAKPEAMSKSLASNLPFVSVIIPTYQEWSLLQLCVDALGKQSYPKDRFEVLVVNNNPADTPPAGFVMPDNFRMLNEARPGSYAARNKALSEARGEIVGFTDSDCIPHQNWISNAVHYLKTNPSCSRIAGKIGIAHEGQKPTATELYNELFAFQQQQHVQETGTCVTANLFTYKKVMDSVGWFDDKIFSCSDLAWGRGANKAGFPIHYVDAVQVLHPARNFAELSKKEKRVGGSQGMRYRGKKAEFVLKRSWNFLNGFRPRIREIQFIWSSGKHLSFYEKLHVLLIRHYMLNIRLLESIKVNLGKKQSRT